MLDTSDTGEDPSQERVTPRVKLALAHFVLDCMRQARDLGKHFSEPVRLDAALLYDPKYRAMGVKLQSSIRRGVQSIGMQCVSLEGLRFLDTHGNEHKLADRLWSPDGSPENAQFSGPYTTNDGEYSTDESVLDHLERFLNRLPPREERVIRLRYGIGGTCDHSLEETGNEFGVTRERIRQIEAKAVRKLAEMFRQLLRIETRVSDVDNEDTLAVLQKRAKPPRKKVDPVEQMEQKLLRAHTISHNDKLLFAQLNGLLGYTKTPFAEVAAANKMTWEQLADRANTLMRRLHCLYIWREDIPVYRREQKIWWPEV